MNRLQHASSPYLRQHAGNPVCELCADMPPREAGWHTGMPAKVAQGGAPSPRIDARET